MPKMIIHAPAGTFDADDRRQAAKALTALGLECEALPRSPFVRSTIWTYFAEYAADAVFMGEETASLPVVTLQVYVLAGGLDSGGRRKLIEGATAILDRRPIGTSVAPVYVVIHESWRRTGASSASRPTSPHFGTAQRTRQLSRKLNVSYTSDGIAAS